MTAARSNFERALHVLLPSDLAEVRARPHRLTGYRFLSANVISDLLASSEMREQLG